MICLSSSVHALGIEGGGGGGGEGHAIACKGKLTNPSQIREAALKATQLKKGRKKKKGGGRTPQRGRKRRKRKKGGKNLSGRSKGEGGSIARGKLSGPAGSETGFRQGIKEPARRKNEAPFACLSARTGFSLMPR